MRVSDFKSLAQAQEPVAITRMVSVPGPTLQALINDSRFMTLKEINSHPDRIHEIKRFTYTHLLGHGASLEEISRWQRHHPNHVISADLASFIHEINGVHLWADADQKRSYFGILPMEGWLDAATWEWSGLFVEPPIGILVLSYHDNGDAYLLLNTITGRFYWYDTEEFDHPALVGESIEGLLDWWWVNASELDPRTT